MRGFRKLVMLGVFLVMLLLVIDTIDAGRKLRKKKELESGKSYNEVNPKNSNRNKQTDKIKQKKLKNIGLQRTENAGEETQYTSKGSRFESNKSDLRNNFKFTNKGKKYTDKENNKTSKNFQKLKKSNLMEDESVEKFNSVKPKVKKTKPQYPKSENIDKIFKTVQKTSQKKLIEENEQIEKILSEELNKFKNENLAPVEETVGGIPKKRKYKLVEVVLQENGQEEEQENDEETVEPELEKQEYINEESEETADRTKTQNPASNKNKIRVKRSNKSQEDQNEESESEDDFNNIEDVAESELNEETTPEDENLASSYEDPLERSCIRLPHDPNRKSPRKLTLYVVEEEIDGQIKKRVVPEEDGVTMCEMADLLTEAYQNKIPIE